MPISVIPKFLQKAFAANGAKTDIPLNADLVNGKAGYTEGFPPITMTAVAAGGIPPAGQDFNGVLYDLSASIQYLQSGVEFPFNAAFAASIGGYASGAIVSDATDKSILWVNGTTSNTAFPAGWSSFAIKDPTETVRGMPLVATSADIFAGTNTSKIITPQGLKGVTSGSFLLLLTTTGAGTYTVPDVLKNGLKKAKIRGVGGGGSGASALSAAIGTSGASGGGGGGYFEFFVDLTGVSTVSYTIGAGGAAPSVGSAGNNGGTTSFGAYASATGGRGGVLGGYALGGQGTAPAGGISFKGGSGGPSLQGTADSFGGGAGGNSALGFGGVNTTAASDMAGYGSGSNGVVNSNTPLAGSGGAIIIEVF